MDLKKMGQPILYKSFNRTNHWQLAWPHGYPSVTSDVSYDLEIYNNGMGDPEFKFTAWDMGDRMELHEPTAYTTLVENAVANEPELCKECESLTDKEHWERFESERRTCVNCAVLTRAKAEANISAGARMAEGYELQIRNHLIEVWRAMHFLVHVSLA